jgi:hypothetical protein
MRRATRRLRRAPEIAPGRSRQAQRDRRAERLIVQFLGDGFLGEDIPHKTLAAIVELGLDLGIECFTELKG